MDRSYVRVRTEANWFVTLSSSHSSSEVMSGSSSVWGLGAASAKTEAA